MTREIISEYFKNQGYPFGSGNSEMTDYFILGLETDRREQFILCIENEIDYCDFERWQHFENVCHGIIPWKDFEQIDAILYTNDIEILEM